MAVKHRSQVTGVTGQLSVLEVFIVELTNGGTDQHCSTGFCPLHKMYFFFFETGYFILSIYLSVCLSVCLSVYLCWFFEKQSYNVAQVGLKLTMLLVQLPNGCDYKCAPPGSAYCELLHSALPCSR
jgi:hypothetical protein